MKICDRCFKLQGRNVVANVVMTIGPENYDLCISCSDIVRNVVIRKKVDNDHSSKVNEVVEAKPKPKKRGRPKLKT